MCGNNLNQYFCVIREPMENFMAELYCSTKSLIGANNCRGSIPEPATSGSLTSIVSDDATETIELISRAVANAANA